MDAMRRLSEAMQEAALAVSTAEGERIYDQLVTALASILKAEYTLISVFVEPARTHLRTLATYYAGKLAKNVEYPIAGTPCEKAIGRRFVVIPADARSAFPGDAAMVENAIEGYAATTLTDARGCAIGALTVMSTQPLADPALAEAMLKIFGARIGSEIERRRSEASYRAIFDATEDAVFLLDYHSGAILDVNPAACAAYGYTREELLRLGISDLGTEEHPYTAQEAMRLIGEVRKGRTMRFEWRRKKKDGSLRWDEGSMKQVEIGGKPYVLAIKREISERKSAEESLRASEEQYRAIFNATADSLVLRDADFRIVDVNPAYSLFSGRGRGEVIGAQGLTMSPAGMNEQVKALHARALGGEPVQFEATATRKNGDHFEIEVRGVPIRHQGEPHVLYIGRDITARKEAEAQRAALEEQLRQAQKMEAIGQLAGGVAHDFNNILQSILGNLVLAGERQEEIGDVPLAKYLERAQRSSLRARDLIRQMLTFSRGQRAERKPVALPALVREAVNLLRSPLPATIELRMQLDEGLPGVSLDAVQIEQVLLNLCINARDAMAGTGTITLAARLSEYRAEHRGSVCASCRKRVSGRWVELSVHDTGAGIAREVMERMFEPFYSTKEVGHGSGMGLAMVHGIVHEHGGHVLVDAPGGAGAAFRLLFEAANAGAGEPAAGAAARPAASRRKLSGRVLVVDDEEMIREFMSDLLGGWGLEVTTIADGASARDAFASDPHAWDLVITDQTMPGLTGMQLARVISRVRPGMPVVLCTGYGEDLTEKDIAAAGVRTLAAKPLEPSQLRTLVETYLPGR
jgi:PAS domain S-box-containing protein